ncbi:MAG: ribbon-helix-helix domain-containing protein [Acidimicrobiales bacterium]|jgi:metal-responsive CopG/Arc/MetJ family transcriptional regulator
MRVMVVIPSYTSELMAVKTAISVPEGTYERATRRARELGMSRSELFSRAVVRYLDELDAKSVTDEIDLAVASSGQNDGSAADAVAAGHRVLAGVSDEW